MCYSQTSHIRRGGRSHSQMKFVPHPNPFSLQKFLVRTPQHSAAGQRRVNHLWQAIPEQLPCTDPVKRTIGGLVLPLPKRCVLPEIGKYMFVPRSDNANTHCNGGCILRVAKHGHSSSFLFLLRDTNFREMLSSFNVDGVNEMVWVRGDDLCEHTIFVWSIFMSLYLIRWTAHLNCRKETHQLVNLWVRNQTKQLR